ncbi:hypothetical protein ISCGN_014910 [Ixodes scapularis]
MLEPRSRAAFERFMERARSSRSGSWGVSLRPEDAMSGEKGVWGEHQARFLAALQELLTESRLSVFGMADVHLTAADFIDTAQEYIEFFKASPVPRELVCFISYLASADALPPDGLCNYVIYMAAGYADGRLLFSDNTSFERFMERARSSRSGSWGVSLRPEDAMSGEKGVWGEHQARFLAALQELLTESRLSVFGMADVHLTAADFIDTAQEYIEFFKASRNLREALANLTIPWGIRPVLFFGIRVLGMTYSSKDAFRKNIKDVLQFVDMFIYQTHISRITKTCVSVFPSNRYYSSANDQDSFILALPICDRALYGSVVEVPGFDDALRILSPPIVARNKFRLVLSLSMSLLRFTMKGPDIEEIRRPCRSMALLPFTEHCNSIGFSEDLQDELQMGTFRYNERNSLVDTFETAQIIQLKMSDVLRELQQRGMDVDFAAFHVEHEDQRGECGRSFHRLWIMAECLRDIAPRRKGTTPNTSQAMFPYYSQ